MIQVDGTAMESSGKFCYSIIYNFKPGVRLTSFVSIENVGTY